MKRSDLTTLYERRETRRELRYGGRLAGLGFHKKTPDPFGFRFDRTETLTTHPAQEREHHGGNVHQADADPYAHRDLQPAGRRIGNRGKRENDIEQ